MTQPVQQTPSIPFHQWSAEVKAKSFLALAAIITGVALAIFGSLYLTATGVGLAILGICTLYFQIHSHKQIDTLKKIAQESFRSH